MMLRYDVNKCSCGGDIILEEIEINGRKVLVGSCKVCGLIRRIK